MKLQPFAQYAAALELHALRHRVLSSNIANADTPGYKARDIDFAAALQSARTQGVSLHRTREGHLPGRSIGIPGVDLGYRVPTQPSLDGNTVETDVEQAAFAENVVRYRAALDFLSGSIRTIRYAIKGGE